MPTLVFRNVDASPDDPVSQWPQEAIQTALERGELSHWRRLAAEIQADPCGDWSLAGSRRYLRTATRMASQTRWTELSKWLARKPRDRSARPLPPRSTDSSTNRASREPSSHPESAPPPPPVHLCNRQSDPLRRIAGANATRRRARERAGRELLTMVRPPGDGPEPNWEDQKPKFSTPQCASGRARERFFSLSPRVVGLGTKQGSAAPRQLRQGVNGMDGLSGSTRPTSGSSRR
jgi:hypothetical protein